MNDESLDDRLAEVLAEYVNRLCAGETITREEVAAAHPDLAGELLQELETLKTLGEGSPGPAALESLGGYRILRQVGRGGMGVVYEAVETAMDRHVALKVLPAEFVADPKAVARFVKEARAAGKLRHSNVVHVYGMGIDRGLPYYAMEFVEGKTLAEILREFVPSDRAASMDERNRSAASISELFMAAEPAEGGRSVELDENPEVQEPSGGEPPEVDLDFCLRIATAFAGAAEGLAHAHSRGVIHRDIKPSNLILDGEGRLRILDFGLARVEGQESLTLSGDLIGTVLYMSPEQAMARRIGIDHRTDVYSLGATLYQMLVWRPPFEGRDHRDTLSRILFHDPAPLRSLNPRIPRDLETIVLKCLQKEPSDRYATAEALAQDLRRFARGDPIEARPPGVIEKFTRRAWRQKGLAGTAAGLILFAVAAGLLFMKYREEDFQARTRAFESRVLEGMMLLEAGQAGPRERLIATGLRDGQEKVLEPESGGVVGFDPVRRALEVLEEARKLRPDRPEAPFHRARAFLALGREPEAVRQLELLAGSEAGRGGGRPSRSAFAPARRLLAEVRAARTKNAPPAGDAASDRGGWQAAYGKANRAALARHREEAASAYTQLLDAFGPEGEPYLGAVVEARLARGRANLELEQLDEALIDFAAVEALHPAAIEPPLLLANTLLRKGETGPARRRLDGIQARTAFKDEAAERIAGLLFEAREYKLVFEWTIHMQDPSARERWQALSLVRLGRGEEARAIAAGLVARRGDDFRSHQVLGKVLLALGLHEEAVAAFEEAARLARDEAGDEPRVWHDLAHAATLRAKYRDHDYGRAFEAARRAADLDPRNPSAHAAVAFIHMQKGELDDARRWLERAHDLDPRSASVLNNLGILAGRTSDQGGAIAWYKTALGIDPGHATIWTNLGWAYCQKKLFDDGIAACNEAIKLNSNDKEAWKILGNNFFHKGAHAEALAAFKKDSEINPSYWLAHYNVARVSEAMGRTEEAIAGYKKAMELNPAHVDSAYNLGNVLSKLDRLDEAIAAYGEALRHKPDWAWAHFNLAEVLAKVDRLDEAAKHFERSIEIDPSDLESYESLAAVYERQGKIKEAQAIREKAIEAVSPPKSGEPRNELREKIVEKLEAIRSGR